MPKTALYIVLCLCLCSTARQACDCLRRGISSREAKGFYETRRINPYQMTGDYWRDESKKDDAGKQSEVENNQITWMPGTTTQTTTTTTTTTTSAATTEKDVKDRKNLWMSEFGETEKIITVRVSSSVARSAAYYASGKSSEKAADSTAEESARASTPYLGFKFRGFAHGSVPQELWVQQTTESPPGNESEGKYYETRIESVSSRKEIVFGRPETSTTPPEPKYEYYLEQRDRFCQLPDGSYDLPEKNYEEPEKNYEEPEKNYEEQERNYGEQERNYELPEKTYEVDESVSLMTNGGAARALSGVGGKLGYVMDGRNFRKYRVEERTPDGFIVGEYGFVRHEDGNLHGVRYTADVTANPRLIYDALLKFLSL